ncbi:phage portal protein [Nocardia terpenica]|uniref:Portal protein n=1 Tax=Nocardia terpenica TaxID=455432 RepID=A0A291RU54_9NOCA|nr:phage portal protein [Nocardia terpenica]ATL70772.1 portal protein [Nocardia terpenica]
MSENLNITVPTLVLSDEEGSVLGQLRSRIMWYAEINRRKQHYYEGRQAVRQLGISVPPQLHDLAVSVGWPGTVVDVLEERLDWQGWTSVTDELDGLDEIYRDNLLGIEASRVHLDTLITGTGFVTVGKGDGSAGEPDVLITVESSSCASAIWDYRKRRVTAALSQTWNELGQIVLETLYLPDETVTLARNADSIITATGTGNNRSMIVVDRDQHNLGRVPVAQLRNRDRAYDLKGRSEISRPVMYYTDAACRTMLGMEVSREFYSAPQRYALGAEPEMFGMNDDSTADDRILVGWREAMGRLNIIPLTEDGDMPQVGQFPSAPPTPYIDLIRNYSQMISAESGIPSSYLGFTSENPSSADAIRQMEYRLVKRAERRQTNFGQAWREVAYLALLVRDGRVDPDFFRTIDVKWQDAATPTRAAAADEALKLTSAGILTADSTVTYDRIGLSAQDQARIIEDKRKTRLNGLVENLKSGAASANANQVVAAAAARKVPAGNQ